MLHRNVDALWQNAIEDVFDGASRSSRNGKMVERIGHQSCLWKIDAIHKNVPNLVQNERRAASRLFASAELIWYMGDDATTDMICNYAPNYFRFADEGVLWGAYGHRFHNDPGFMRERTPVQRQAWPNQLIAIVRELNDHVNSRRAVVVLWNGGDLPHAVNDDKADLPCTLTMQFMKRDDQLHMIVTMRSEDVWLGMPYDLHAFLSIQELVASATRSGLGSYIHQVGSLHAYEKDWPKLQEAQRVVTAIPQSHNHIAYEYSGEHLKADMEAAVRCERWSRTSGTHVPGHARPRHIILCDAVNACIKFNREKLNADS